MIIRLGFVSHALSLFEGTPAKALTFANYSKKSPSEAKEKLLEVTGKNLETTKRIIHYCIAQQISVYRMSSSIVPLATHPEAKWDYVTPFKKEWEEVGQLVRDHSLRVSFHPNQFTLFTSPEEHVTQNALSDFDYHSTMLDALGLEGVINIHIGGTYGDKEATLKRFYQQVTLLPSKQYKRMTLENDDKTYTMKETLEACQKLRIPMVFDYHHHICNPGAEPDNWRDLLPHVFDTWKQSSFRPKIHLSSPQVALEEKGNSRKHADHVDPLFAAPLLAALRDIGQDVDIMLESKKKDLSLFLLMEEWAKIRGVKRINGGTLFFP